MRTDLTDLKSDMDSVFFSCVKTCLEPMLVTDINATILYVNPAWERTFGYTATEAIGARPSIVRSPETSEETYLDMWDHLIDSQRGNWRGEIVNQSKQGKRIPVYLSINAYYKENTLAGFMGTAIDLTEQKYLEAQILQQNRLATIGELTSGLAHELGTPIGVIRGRAEMLSTALPKLNPQQKNISIIIKQTDRITSLINTLLRLSRATHKVELASIDLLTQLNDLVQLLDPKLRKNQIRIEIDIADELRICGETNRLEQIFINLVMNAIHAIKSRESLRPGEGIIQIRAVQRGNETQVHVSDNGCGIPPDQLNKIFEPFFTTKPSGEGTGLGLSIIAKVIEEIHGRIAVASVPNEGTTFTLFFQTRCPSPTT